VITIVAGTLVALSFVFEWWDLAVFCLLGIVVGALVSYIVRESSQHRREFFYVAIAFGMLVVPALAVYLSSLAAGHVAAFTTWNSSLTAFVAYALAIIATSLIVAAIWRQPSVEPAPEADEAQELDEWRLLEAETGHQDVEEPTSQVVVGGRG